MEISAKDLREKWIARICGSMNYVYRCPNTRKLFCSMLIGEAKDVTPLYHKVAERMGGWLRIDRDACHLCLPVIDGNLISLQMPKTMRQMHSPCLEAVLPTGTDRIQFPILREMASHFYFLKMHVRHYAYYVKLFPKFAMEPAMLLARVEEQS